jgi:ATP-dependent helicase/nuclease subunit A
MPKLRDSGKIKELKGIAEHAGLEEFHRLLYVAMTRARDELYVCGYQGLRDPPAGNWHELIAMQLQQMPGTRRLPDGILRYGADPTWSETAAATETQGVAMPPWFAHPVIAPPAARSSTITTLAKDETDSGPVDQDALDRGKVIHRLLQLLPDVPMKERPALARHIVKRSGQPEAVAGMVLDLLGHEALAPLLCGDALPEVALTATLPNIAITVNGRIDRLIVEDRNITIVDYKTDRRWPHDLRSVPASYGRQMALYREVMRNAYPGRDVNCVLVWTAAPAVMALPSSFLDQALSRLMAART